MRMRETTQCGKYFGKISPSGSSEGKEIAQSFQGLYWFRSGWELYAPTQEQTLTLRSVACMTDHSCTTPAFSGQSWARWDNKWVAVLLDRTTVAILHCSPDEKGRCLVMPHATIRAQHLTTNANPSPTLFRHGLSPGAHECGYNHKCRPCTLKDSTCSFSPLFTPTKRRHQLAMEARHVSAGLGIREVSI